MQPRALLIALALVLGACQAAPPTHQPDPNTEPDTPRATNYEDLRPFLGDRKKDYPLYPGDTIRITVLGHDELTVERRIPANGKVPIVGARSALDSDPGAPVVVEVAGKRIPEIETELRDLYSVNITNPYVTVSVTSYSPKTIYVTGAVESPRDYRLPDEERVSLVQALTMAGWFTPDAAQDRVRVIRQSPNSDGRIYLPPIDVARILAGGEVEMDILLEPGDTVTVDSKESQSVYIFGFVENPGEVAYARDLTLTRLITRAGGLEEFAKKSDIRVLRHSTRPEPDVFHVNLEKVFGGEAPDFALRPGDVIYVDETFF